VTCEQTGPTLPRVSVVNPLAREISAKIVFYGPGLSGKTSSLSYLHSTVRPTHRGDLLSLATEGDRTLFFDFLPLQLPRIKGLDVRLQLYTVPGQVFYGATRKLVLDGADGVVFVADSQIAAQERNLEALDDLRANLNELGVSLESLPLVFQYNKRDLPAILQVDELRRELNGYGAPEFETCASTGRGVSDALRAIVKRVSQSLMDKESKSRGKAESGQRLAINPSALSEAVAIESHRSGMAFQLSNAIARLELVDEDAEMDVSLDVEDAPESSRPVPRDVKTIQAPAASLFSFSTLWDEPLLVTTIEADISTGHFAEAVHRAASGVSDILDGLLGPHVVEGSGTRAQLLGIEGREYLELRRLASRPASTITQNEALFALYMLIAARVKAARLAPY